MGMPARWTDMEYSLWFNTIADNFGFAVCYRQFEIHLA